MLYCNIYKENPRPIYKFDEKIVDVTMEYNDKYNVWISPVFQNYELFKQREKIVPYYQNIQKEGIRIG